MLPKELTGEPGEGHIVRRNAETPYGAPVAGGFRTRMRLVLHLQPPKYIPKAATRGA